MACKRDIYGATLWGFVVILYEFMIEWKAKARAAFFFHVAGVCKQSVLPPPPERPAPPQALHPTSPRDPS